MTSHVVRQEGWRVRAKLFHLMPLLGVQEFDAVSELHYVLVFLNNKFIFFSVTDKSGY